MMDEISEKKQTILKVKNFAKENSLNDDIHGFEHVKRVCKLSLAIGKNYNANLYILEIAALLHDIGRIDKKENASNQNHAELSAQKSLKFFKREDLNLNQEEIKNIIHAISTHSFSNKIAAQTLEAKILSDADKLDALGAIGLYRTIGFTIKNKGNLKDVIKHLEEKILNLRTQMNLKISKKIAEKRHKIIKTFYEKIKTQF
jgi:uncharacterized protein